MANAENDNRVTPTNTNNTNRIQKVWTESVMDVVPSKNLQSFFPICITILEQMPQNIICLFSLAKNMLGTVCKWLAVLFFWFQSHLYFRFFSFLFVSRFFCCCCRLSMLISELKSKLFKRGMTKNAMNSWKRQQYKVDDAVTSSTSLIQKEHNIKISRARTSEPKYDKKT